MRQETDKENENEESNGKDSIPEWMHERAERLARGLFANDKRVRKNAEE
ncbi:MAG: hypothetical protein OXG88_01200 [Gammaproteobacteria bacterium]|nr:hypothetical protein [Gammaproteobacteria bacterium]MDE2739395.1 hypothetical protein [Paracoccaceae bacterium]